MFRRLVATTLTASVLLTGTASAHDGIFRRTNEFRWSQGVHRLRQNDHLNALAYQRAKAIYVAFGHAFYWLNLTRCGMGGENLAYRRPALDSNRARWFVEAWKDSDSHRRVMLMREWNRMGSAIYIGPDAGMYGVQLFCDP